MEHHHGSGLLRASATYLGLSVTQVKAKLKGGQTLGEIANATLAAHRITSAQESAFLSKVQAKLTQLVGIKWSDRARMDWHH